MARTARLILATLVVACLFGCPRKDPPAPPKAGPKHPPEKVWTPEEMASKPEEYLQWADSKIQAQIAQGEARLKVIDDRLKQVRGRQDELKQKMSDAQNIHDRMEKAIQKSEDEDRLPIQMAGRTFSNEQAKQIVTQSLKWIDDRRSLAQAYEQAVAKLEGGAGDQRRDLDSMARLRERIALDLEKVRLNQGVAEMQQLNNTEAEIRGFSKVLGSNDDTIGLANLPKETKDSGKVDIDSFMKN